MVCSFSAVARPLHITNAAQTAEHAARLNQESVGSARVADGFLDLGRLGVEAGAQRRDLRVNRLPFAFELAPSAGDFLLTLEYLGALARLLGDARGAGQDAGEPGINVGQLRAVAGQDEFPDLIGMRRAARL